MTSFSFRYLNKDIFLYFCLSVYKQMHKCCSLDQVHRPQRRINGLQLPLNYQQVIGWMVFVTTGLINFVILVRIQFDKLKIASQIIFIILYVSHTVSHLTASLIDPSEEELRKLEVNTVPEFDRNIHAHVIENGRCHLCNIFTSSKKTKHCSLCNKCVDRFDHHCKWLNSCVGRRNYGAFIASVVTALLLAIATSSLCLADIVLFLTNPQLLSPDAQDIINCNKNQTNADLDVKYCKNSVMFLLFLIIFGVSALAIGCALLHLYCFHVYISMLGVSTYEYILRSGTPPSVMPQFIKKCPCCTLKLSRKTYILSKSKTNKQKPVTTEEGPSEVKGESTSAKRRKLNSSPANSDTNVANLISIIVNNELEKARKIFMNDKNKIHPQEENS